MRILHVNKFFDLQGGAEVYLHELMENQQKAGHEVHAFSTRSPKNVLSPDADLFVTRFDLDRRDGAAVDAQKAINFVWNQEARRAMREAIAHIKPDVVHLHNIYHHLSTSIFSPIKAADIPIVQTLHDYKLACPNYKMYTEGAPCERCKGGNYHEAIKHRCLSSGFVGNLLGAFEMKMTKAVQTYEKNVELFLCPSRFMKEKMEDWGEPAAKMRYVPNPTTWMEVSAPRGGGYLLYVGRLSSEKGLMGLLKACVRMPDIPLKIVGRGPEETRLRAFADKHGASHIEFVGFQPPSEVAKIRARAEALLLPSVWYENASGAVLEGMAHGLPCLVTRIGGNPELIEDGVSGYLVKPDDTDDWMRVIRRFQALSTDARDQMGQKSREGIQKDRLWSQHLERVMECYNEAIQMGQKR